MSRHSAQMSFVESVSGVPTDPGPFTITLRFRLRDPQGKENAEYHVVLAWVSNDPETGVPTPLSNGLAVPLILKPGQNEIGFNVEPELPFGGSCTLTVNGADQGPFAGLPLTSIGTDIDGPLYLILQLDEGLLAIGPMRFQ